MGRPGCESASPDTDGGGSVEAAAILARGQAEAALLRRLGGAAPTADGATRVPISTADGEQPAG